MSTVLSTEGKRVLRGKIFGVDERLIRRAPKKNRVKLSPALMAMVDRELKEFNTKSDEAFLVRADMDKKLNFL